MRTLRILLVDDHMLFRKGLAALFATRPGLEVVGEAGDGIEALRIARETLPDVILMDISMPHQNGLEATRSIKREMPHTKIVILTVSADDKNLFEAVKAGAQGYLLKDMKPEELYGMLERISQGEAPLSGLMAAKILEEFAHPRPAAGPESDTYAELSTREEQVLRLIATGMSNREIAATLSLTENTVKIHLHNILEKLHLENRIQAAVYAVRSGLAGTDPSES